jgi:NAD(P)-dependent dehydrogenase (short-subunit alcohol dehydrogenase family)
VNTPARRSTCLFREVNKFGLEGFMESLHAEVAPFGITTTTVNPWFFRTELLSEQSTNYATPSIADYDERRTPLLAFWKSQNGKQGGDPAKLARARHDRGAEPAAEALHRGRRCDHRSGAEGGRAEGADRLRARPIDLPRNRLKGRPVSPR